jgi:hypothetical protein
MRTLFTTRSRILLKGDEGGAKFGGGGGRKMAIFARGVITPGSS